MANVDLLPEDRQDFANEYLAHREDVTLQTDSAEMTNWLLEQDRAVVRPYRPIPEPEAHPLEPFPTDRRPPEHQSAAGMVARSFGEMPRQILGGIDDAGRNALGILDPLANWLNANVADLSYDPVSDPKTTTGAAARSVSQFLTGFVPALKGLRALGAGKVLAPMAAGAVADFSVFDPQQDRLSNLWQDLGLPQNALTDYLAADPTDSEAAGRLKNAVEGLGLGALTDGLVLGVRALRSVRRGAARAQEAVTAQLRERYGELSDASFQTIGDPSKPMIETVVRKPHPAGAKIAKGLEATAETTTDDLFDGRGVVDAGDMQVYINFARMSSPDDVKAVIADMAEKFKGSIDDARRGEISHEETSRLAEEMGMSVPDLLSRRQGQPFNAEEAVSARRLWAASGEKLLESARKAADPNGGPVDQFVFRKMLATHYAIQAEVIGARTETARALASWKIPVGGSIEKARAIEQTISAMGGPEATQEMARRLAILAEHGDPAAVAKFAQKGWGATTFDAVREVWVNGLLSSPKTHVVNVTSNLAVAFQQIYERGAAAQIGLLRGAEDSVAPGEALAMAYGMVSSISDAFRMAGKALRTGESGWALNKVDLPRDKAMSAEAFRIGSETGLGRAVDFIGEAARVPGRFLGAEDEFFKTIGYRMELHAQALRQATQEGHKGPALRARMREILLDPPENIRISAADAALYNTFTNAPGSIGQAFLNLREQVPAVSFILPFVRTPVNITRYAFERSPFAPLVSQWRDDIAAGGARADLALARMGTGSAIMAMALDWADSGQISGMGPKRPEREAMMRQGWQQYSVKVGDRWYSYNRLDPFGMTMGFAADIAQAIRKGEIDQDDVDEWQEVMAMAITAVSQVTINKTYLQGLAQFSEMMADPGRYSEGYIKNLVASFLPVTALAGAIERAADPTVREAASPWEAVQAKIAGASKTLPPRRTLWGEEIRAESGLGKTYDFFSPVQATQGKPTPIDTELMRLSDAVAGSRDSLPQRIRKRTSFDGVVVNFRDWPEVYDEYVRLAGNEFKHPAWNLGTRDFLNAVVSGQHPMSKVYDIRSDEMKLGFVRNAIEQYRSLTQQAILRDKRFSGFADYVATLRQEKVMPVLQ
jgi:hypothetical protein